MSKRLTERDLIGAFVLTGVDSETGFGPVRGAVIDKLADYEDAEEQGLLVRLPCPIGERVYVINSGYYCEFPDAGTTCGAGAKYRACEYYSNLGGCHAPPYDHSLEIGVRTKPFEYEDIPQIGKSVFATSAEAEAALQAREEAELNADGA